MNKISWIIFSVVTVGVLTGLVIFSKSTSLDVSKVNVNIIQTTNNQNGNIADHVFGKIGSKVTLIEYGDLQCPPCGSIHQTIRAITEQYEGQLQFVFRNFPMPTIHANARAAAAAAESAGIQGKYWEMHNEIFENQDIWSELDENDRAAYFSNLAKKLSLNKNKFETDMASTSVTKKIDYDLAIGKKAGVQGTPTFVLNGKTLETDAFGSEEKLRTTINNELKKAGIALPN